MAWSEVPAKLSKYRSQEYGGDEQADKLLGQFFIHSDADIDMIPAYKRDDFERELDHRQSACDNLATSRAWSPAMLRKV